MKSITSLGAALALQFLYCSHAAGAVIIADTFTPGDGTGSTGGFLNGVNVETGSGTWESPNYWEFTAAGNISGHTANGIGLNTRIAHVDINAASIITGQITRVSGGVVTTDPDANHWAAVGYANNPLGLADSSFWNTGVGQLWMWINNNGLYEVWANGTTKLLGSGTAASFVPGAVTNDISVQYDQLTNRASAFVNGVAIVDNFDLSSGTSFTPTISAVGFHLRGPNPALPTDGQPMLTSFSLESVPEPSRLMLAFFGFTSALVRRRRSGFAV